MIALQRLTGLQIDSDLVTTGSPNFAPSAWPPSDDFPVVIDRHGVVATRFGDVRWDFSPWANRTMRFTFGGSPRRGRHVDPQNARLFRMIAGYWLWGPGAARSPRTLIKHLELIRPVFARCTEEGISAADLFRFPKVTEKLAADIYPSSGNTVISLLNDLWLYRETLGFTVLDDAGLKILSGLITVRESTQTPYIPPRIWSYQALRLKECLDDYIQHRSAIEACYRFCLKAYAQNVGGSLRDAFKLMPTGLKAFNPTNAGRSGDGLAFYGPFRDTAARFGIDALLERWVNTSPNSGIKCLTSYLSLITHVGHAYVLTFSLMRAEEATTLRANCHLIERDGLDEDVHQLRGVTTKTISDDDARWIVSPSVEVAIKAMTSVARLRVEAGRHHPDLALSRDQVENPYLFAWAMEPWAAAAVKSHLRTVPSYSQLLKAWPKLMSLEHLRLTNADLDVANRMTFGLDPEEFAVGKIWPLAWHQLRRTGAVNMLATGHVSDSSLQYQMKHASRAMTRYYGQNFYRLKGRLDEEAKGFYLREMYQALARDLLALREDHFISPHGPKRKEQLLAPISVKDHQGLLKDATAGRLSYRETSLGGCCKPGDACPLGGISNISGCMGFGVMKACEYALVDARKRATIVKLHELAAASVRASPPSPLRDSLVAQMEAAKRALDVIDKV